tara:strand:+ start:2290 stop:2469 length:180 start_codon:yes stop_codon:yes gene_type:complete
MSNGQYAFTDDAKVYVKPTKLTEDREAWQGKEQQGSLFDHEAELAKMEAWIDEPIVEEA